MFMDWTPLPERQNSPSTALFTIVPNGHNEVDSLKFRLNFDKRVDITDEELSNHALIINGGSISNIKGRSGRQWDITVTPDSGDAVSVTLHEAADCQELGAICTESGEQLYNYPAFTVPGPSGNTTN